MALITKRKRMMDSVGHYARPELLSLRMDARPARYVVNDAQSGDTRDSTASKEESDEYEPSLQSATDY